MKTQMRIFTYFKKLGVGPKLTYLLAIALLGMAISIMSKEFAFKIESDPWGMTHGIFTIGVCWGLILGKHFSMDNILCLILGVIGLALSIAFICIFSTEAPGRDIYLLSVWGIGFIFGFLSFMGSLFVFTENSESEKLHPNDYFLPYIGCGISLFILLNSSFIEPGKDSILYSKTSGRSIAGTFNPLPWLYPLEDQIKIVPVIQAVIKVRIIRTQPIMIGYVCMNKGGCVDLIESNRTVNVRIKPSYLSAYSTGFDGTLSQGKVIELHLKQDEKGDEKELLLKQVADTLQVDTEDIVLS